MDRVLVKMDLIKLIKTIRMKHMMCFFNRILLETPRLCVIQFISLIQAVWASSPELESLKLEF